MKIFLETDRFLLREIVEADAQDMFELDSDPLVHKYLGNKPITHISQAEEIVQYVRNQYKENGIGRWAIMDKVTQDFIGWTGLKYEDYVRKDFDYYDIGYRLKKKYWGKGIATETALASMEYGFKQLNLEEIFGGAHIDNIASNVILKKIGLQFIEVFDYEDMPHNWYGVKREKWLSLRT